MQAEQLLARLQKVRPNGKRQWTACCPAHDDRSPSLAIREAEDSRLLVYCFGGCGIEDILAAIGLDISDLFPEKLLDGKRPIPKPFFPGNVFAILSHEIAIAALIAADLHKNRAVSQADYDRLLMTVNRLNRIAGAVYGS